MFNAEITLPKSKYFFLFKIITTFFTNAAPMRKINQTC